MGEGWRGAVVGGQVQEVAVQEGLFYERGGGWGVAMGLALHELRV